MPEVHAVDHTGYTAGSVEAGIADTRLELGAGYRPSYGFTHQDINPGNHIEIVCDCRDMNTPGRWQEVRATHLLEHFSYWETVNVLKNWRNLLVAGGSLYLEVPSLTGQMAAYQEHRIDDRELVRLVYADQDYAENFHYAGFTRAILTEDLEKAGFVNVRVEEYDLILTAWGSSSLQSAPTR